MLHVLGKSMWLLIKDRGNVNKLVVALNKGK